MAKEKEARRPFNLKKEVKLLPGYIILLLWVIFTIALLGWVFGITFRKLCKSMERCRSRRILRKFSDLFRDFLHNSDPGVRTGSLCTVKI